MKAQTYSSDPSGTTAKDGKVRSIPPREQQKMGWAKNGASKVGLDRDQQLIRRFGNMNEYYSFLHSQRIATATQAIENRIRELQIQMAQLKQNLDVEMGERAAQAEMYFGMKIMKNNVK